MTVRLERLVSYHLGWRSLVRLKQCLQVLQPRLALVDAEQQARFKKLSLAPAAGGSAAAFPEAGMELWAVDEHGIGLKPLLPRMWVPIECHPIVSVPTALPGALVVGFVHWRSVRARSIGPLRIRQPVWREPLTPPSSSPS